MVQANVLPNNKVAFSSHFDDVKHEESVTFSNDVIELYAAIGDGAKSAWKFPIQTGITLALSAALQIQDLFPRKCSFHFLHTSRFSRGALKNLFSTFRAKYFAPRTLGFKSALRTVTMTQFMRLSRSSSYTDDEGFILTGMPPKDSVKPGKSVEYPDDILLLNVAEKIVTPDPMRCMQSSNW